MTLAMDNHMKLVCFALAAPENIIRVVCGEKIGTIVKED
jgi:uridylate kinase